MKNILVPIDFSDTSLAAFFVAEKIAEKFDATIDVVHIYDGSINTNKGMTFELMQTNEDVILNRLKKFIHPTENEGDTIVAKNIDCKTYLAYNTAQKLSKLSKDYDLVVLGMTGERTIEKKLIGSIAAHLAEHAHCPVLLVPNGHLFKGITNIVYARNWESANSIALQSVIDFGKVFYAAIHFLHINETLDVMDFSLTEQESLVELLAEDAPEIAYHVANVDSASIKKGIEDYAHENDADLIVLVNRHHTFLDKLLRRSLTKAMSLHSDIPLLIYHTQK